MDFEYERKKNVSYGDELLTAVAAGNKDECSRLLKTSKYEHFNQINFTFPPLFLAAKMGFKEILIELLENGADINVVDHNRLTALHYAANYAKSECCLALMNMGINYNVHDNSKNSHCLHIAASEGLTELVDNFMWNCVDTSLQDENKKTALHRAAEKGHAQILSKILLANESLYNAKDIKLCTPLHYAALHNHTDCCQMLLNASGENRENYTNATDDTGNTALHYAAENGSSNAVELLLTINPTPCLQNNNGQTPLHLVATLGKLESNKQLQYCLTAQRSYENVLTQLLSNSEFYFNAKDKEERLPLHYAAMYDHRDCCEALIASSSEEEIINAKDKDWNTPVHYAAEKGFINTLEVLLTMNPNLSITNKNGDTPIHLAVIKGNKQCTEKLFQKDSEQDPQPNKEGNNVLALATISGSKETLNYLLQHEIFQKQINKSNLENKTPLHLAAVAESSEICHELLRVKNINCNMLDNRKNLPLHYAAWSGLTDICKELLNSNNWKTVNEKNKMGATPLHLATSQGFFDTCKILLLNCASIIEMDIDGFTPIDIGAIEGHYTILQLFFEDKDRVNLIKSEMKEFSSSPLHLAAKGGHTDCVKLIIEKISNISFISFNEGRRSGLDEAFYNNKDETFNVILSAWSTDAIKIDEEFMSHDIHHYMHLAIEDDRRKLQKSIIDSKWWFSGFSSEFCHEGICQNFRRLIENNPEAAKIVLDNCITNLNDETEVFNFLLLENIYFIQLKLYCSFCNQKTFDIYGHMVHDHDNENQVKQLIALQNDSIAENRSEKQTIYYNLEKERMWRNRLNKPQKMRESAFNDDIDDYLLQPNIELEKFNNDPKNSNVLNVAIKHKRLDLLKHPLVETYLFNKWSSYMGMMLFLFFINEVIMTVSIGFLVSYMWTMTQLNETFTEYTLERLTECPEDLPIALNVNLVLRNSILTVIFIWIFVLGLFKTVKLHSNSKNWRLLFKLIRFGGVIVFIFPYKQCFQHIFLATTWWQWQIGVVTFWLFWMNMLHSLNEFPFTSLFMPITRKLVKSFVKFVIYIFLILSVYVIIFRQLLQKKTPFSTIYYSFMKTVVWFLGDLGYDDIFHDKDDAVPYPLLTNLTFLIFITSITGFLAHLIISHPQDHLDAFKSNAEDNRIISRIQLVLKYDLLFDHFRLKHTVSKKNKPRRFTKNEKCTIHQLKMMKKKKYFRIVCN